MGMQNHPKGPTMNSSHIISIILSLIFILHQTLSLTVNELHGKYYEIFSRAHNRNAASHLWASYILDRSTTFSASEIRELFGGFCPISGSPVRPSNRNLWTNIQFKKASNPSQTESGNVHVCCWPCVCDLQEFVKTDTLDVDTKYGRTSFDVLVIGDPCVHPERIPSRAPEVYCQNGKLAGATRSTNDHIVIGMLQTEENSRNQASRISNRCSRRKNQGYRSGMGTIFVEVASINPIN